MSRGLVWIVLGVFAALIVAERWHTRDEPLETDLGIYAVIGHGLLEGRDLYSDLWDRKPPAIHITYAAAEALLGYGPGSILFLNLVAALATMLGVYRAGSASGFGYVGGLAAAGFWTILGGDLKLQANQPNAEVFINSCLIWAFALLVARETGRLGYGRAAVIGLLFAVASLYKHVVIAPAGCLALVHCVYRPADTRRKHAFLEAGVMLAVIVLAWGAVCGYFFSVGRWQPFYEAVFTYNKQYAFSPTTTVVLALCSSTPFASFLSATEPLAGLAGVGLVVGLLLGPSRPWRLWLAWALGTYLAVYLPGRNYAHYWQLWLPPLAVAAGWSIALGPSMPKLLALPVSRIIQGCLPLVVLLCEGSVGLALLVAAVPLLYSQDEAGQPTYPDWLRLGTMTVALLGAAIAQPYGGNDWLVMLALAWALVGLQGIAMPRHYWLPVLIAFGVLVLHAPFGIWLPAAALALVGITPFLTGPPVYISRLLTVLAAGVATLLLVWTEAPLYRLSADQWSAEKYGNSYIRAREVAEHIAQILEPGETFYELGSHTCLYFYSGRLPPAGIFYDFPFSVSPFTDSFSRRVVDDLQRSPPELWIYSREIEDEDFGTKHIVNWVSAHYRPAPSIGKFGRFRFWVLRGGKLEKRLAEQTGSQVRN